MSDITKSLTEKDIVIVDSISGTEFLGTIITSQKDFELKKQQILKNQLIVEKIKKLLTDNFDWQSTEDTTKVCMKIMRLLEIPIYDVD